MYIPPFSPDYSGVCSALFDFGALIMIHDAAGCTGNYTGFDEPRWYGSKAPIYCSGIREIDAVLGNEEKFIDRVVKAAKSIAPPIIALVGSPVPMVIGADLSAIAIDIENITGIPCFGFNTTGTKHYNFGIAESIKSLIRRFANRDVKKQQRTVNILGATPLDFSTTTNIEDLVAFLESNGYKVNCCFSRSCSLDEVENMCCASVNIAVSQSGYDIAKFVEQVYKIPFITGLPIGECAGKAFLEKLIQTENQKKSTSIIGKEHVGCAKTLIVGEQVISNSLRVAMQKECGYKDIDVGSIFGRIPELCTSNDINLKSEVAIETAVNHPKYEFIIADPLVKQLVHDPGKIKFFQFAHYAVSSKFFFECNVNYISNKFNRNFIERC